MDGSIWFLLLVAIYMAPTLIAANRKHTNLVSIFAINLWLGWTFVGWVVALAWSASADPNNPNRKPG